MPHSKHTCLKSGDLKAIAGVMNIPPTRLYRRLELGWPLDLALTLPSQKGRKPKR
jgi:hypothetical protein